MVKHGNNTTTAIMCHCVLGVKCSSKKIW